MSLSALQKVFLSFLKPILVLYLSTAAVKDVAADADCQTYLAALTTDQKSACEGFIALVVSAVAKKIGVA